MSVRRESRSVPALDRESYRPASKRFSLALEGEWTSERVGGEPNYEGFQNPGILLKYGLWKIPSREFILSPALEIELPLGDRDVGAERDTTVAPLMLFAKGFGDLPRTLSYLRPLALNCEPFLR